MFDAKFSTSTSDSKNRVLREGPCDIIAEIRFLHPELNALKSHWLQIVTAEVRKYDPALEIDESIQIARWAKRRPEGTYFAVEKVFKKFREMFPYNVASDDVLSKAYNL